jgi:hypothetical protein
VVPKAPFDHPGLKRYEGVDGGKSEEKYPPFVYPFDMVFRALPAQYAQDAQLNCMMQAHSSQVLVAFMAFGVETHVDWEH